MSPVEGDEVMILIIRHSSILTGLPAGAYGAANEQMARAWNIDETNFPYLSFALVSWNMGAAAFPLVFVPLTENTGRMPGYFVSSLPLFPAQQAHH